MLIGTGKDTLLTTEQAVAYLFDQLRRDWTFVLYR